MSTIRTQTNPFNLCEGEPGYREVNHKMTLAYEEAMKFARKLKDGGQHDEKSIIAASIMHFSKNTPVEPQAGQHDQESVQCTEILLEKGVSAMMNRPSATPTRTMTMS